MDYKALLVSLSLSHKLAFSCDAHYTDAAIGIPSISSSKEF